MTKELSTINQDELDDFINRSGSSQEDLIGGGDYLPQLKVNYLEEDENGKELKKGYFVITGQDVPVYAKNVVIRPLLHHFQWTKYDQEVSKTVNRTIFISNFREEPRDELGTLRCGKPPSKELKNNPALAKKYEDVTVYRNVHALVSYEGEDVDGNKVTVENMVAVLRLKGANFIPFSEEFIEKMPKNTNLWDFAVTLSVTKEKNDPKSANSYYVIHYEADFDNRLPLTVPVFDTLKGLQERIEKTNEEIEKKHFTVVHNRKLDDSVIAAIDNTNASLEDDLVDEDA